MILLSRQNNSLRLLIVCSIVIRGVRSFRAPSCLPLPRACSRGFYVVDVSNDDVLRQVKIHRVATKGKIFAGGRHTSIFMSPNEDRPNSNNNIKSVLVEKISGGLDGILFPSLMICIPFLSIVFPVLLEIARSSEQGSSEQFAVASLLFGSNRMYLYAMSTTIVSLAALRGSQDDTRLGQRVVDLTEEMLFNPPLDEKSKAQRKKIKLDFGETDAEGEKGKKELPEIEKTEEFETPSYIESLSEGLGNTLDEVSTEKQAIALPLLVSALLASSVFFLQIVNSGQPAMQGEDSYDGMKALISFVATYLPLLGIIWNAAVLSLFSRCEIRNLFYQLDLPFHTKKYSWLPWIIGGAITIIAYSGIWPAQNFVNMALAILVARAIQINNFPAIVAALCLLTLYDGVSVLLVQPAVAATIESSTVQATATATSIDLTTNIAAAPSAMATVAMDKLSSATFQPGLLVTKIGNSFGGALGLGDAVFPSILAIHAKRYDRQLPQTENRSISLFAASIGGYIGGCVACEFAPSISTSGVPALLFIIPFMLGSVVTVAAVRGDLQDVWDFKP